MGLSLSLSHFISMHVSQHRCIRLRFSFMTRGALGMHRAAWGIYYRAWSFSFRDTELINGAYKWFEWMVFFNKTRLYSHRCQYLSSKLPGSPKLVETHDALRSKISRNNSGLPIAKARHELKDAHYCSFSYTYGCLSYE